MSLAWHTAQLVQIGMQRKRDGRPVKLPELKTMLIASGKARSRPMTVDEQFEYMKNILVGRGK